jgi:hypothetical protein
MNLQFLVEAGLLTKTKVNIRSYLDARKDYEGPSLPTVSSLYNRERGLGISRSIISDPSISVDRRIAIFEPPLIDGKRLMIGDEGEWKIFCREAGFNSEDKTKRETELVDCSTQEVEIAAWNYVYGGSSQGYMTRKLSNALLMCRNGTMEIVKKVACHH